MINQVKTLIRQITDIYSLLNRMLVCGKVSAIEPQTQRVKVLLPGHNNDVTDWLPVLTRRAQGVQIYSLPQVGEQVWCLFLPIAGMEKGIVLGTSFNDVDTAPTDNPDQFYIVFKDGTTFYYDQVASKCELNMPQGTLVVTAPDGATFNNDVKITGKLDVVKNIHSDAEVSDKVRSMSGDRQIYNSHDHNKAVGPPKKQQ